MLSCILLLGCVDLVADSTCRRCARRGACLLCRLLPPAFSLLSCPLSPQPALAERSSPAGKGETISLFCRGLRPRHPCTEPPAALIVPAKQVPTGGLPRRYRLGGRWRCPAAGLAVPGGGLGGFGRLLTLPPLYPAGACLLCRLPTPPSACFPAPYPPPPLPRRGRGNPKVYFAGGFAPGTPALNRLRHLQSLPLLYPAGACPVGCRLTLPPLYPAGACLVGRLPPLPLACFTAPYPPDPLPRRGRGRPRLFHARGSAPCIRKLKISPFPAGEGGWGDGGKIKS